MVGNSIALGFLTSRFCKKYGPSNKNPRRLHLRQRGLLEVTWSILCPTESHRLVQLIFEIRTISVRFGQGVFGKHDFEYIHIIYIYIYILKRTVLCDASTPRFRVDCC